MPCRVLLLFCAALAVAGAANPRQLEAVRHFLERHRQPAAAPPHVLRTFIEPKQNPKERQQPAPQAPTPTPSPWFDCPTEFGLYPDPYDCNSYFQCSYSVPFEEKCLPNLEFNPKSSACDFPENIDPPCQAIPYPSPSGPRPAEQQRRQSHEKLKDLKKPLAPQAPTPTPSPWFDCPTEFGLYPDPYDCNSYFQCSYSVPFEQKCLPNLVFNPKSSACDFPENIDPPCQAIPYPSASGIHVPVPPLPVHH